MFLMFTPIYLFILIWILTHIFDVVFFFKFEVLRIIWTKRQLLLLYNI